METAKLITQHRRHIL